MPVEALTECVKLFCDGNSFEFHTDNAPNAEVQEVRISLFSKGNYNRTANRLVKALLYAETSRTQTGNTRGKPKLPRARRTLRTA